MLRLICALILGVVTFLSAPLAPASAQSVSDVITSRSLAAFSPRARADLVDALVSNRAMLDDGNIKTPSQFLHFMAQIAAETGGFVTIKENMNYTASRLRVVFPKYVRTDAHARRLERKPVEIANWVYGGRLGNRGQNTMDGWNYRGSGFIQLTGRENFRRRGEEVGLPLENNPELARQPKEGLQAAVAYWSAKCNDMADTATIEAVRRCVNGGTNGLDEARLWHGRARQVFGPIILAAGLEGEDVVSQGVTEEIDAAKSILERLGYYEPSPLEAEDEEAFRAALESFSIDNGLDYFDSTGKSGLESASEEGLPEELLYELTKPEGLIAEREATDNGE